MKLVWHGTASVELISESGRILFDPFVPFPGSSVDVKIEDFDGFPDIFVTHGHFDHISSLPGIILRNPDTVVHCTETPYASLLKKGVPEKNLSLLFCGDELETDGFSIRVLQGRHAVLPELSKERIRYMLHSPARRNIARILREHRSCPENGETLFYEIRAEQKTVFLIGSLNLGDDVAYPQGCDLLVLPYNGWEDNEPPAVRVIERLAPERIVLDHYDDTFPPLTMPIDLNGILDRYKERIMPLALGAVIEI